MPRDHLQKRPSCSPSAPLIDKILAIGVNAPNPHNTQAWKIRRLSEHSADLFVDEKRLLPVTDPPARQIHIGCGCFLETASIGASMLRCKVDVELFPLGEYSFSEIGRKPVARVTVFPSSTEIPTDEAAKHIFGRRTNRRPYTGSSTLAPEDLPLLESSYSDNDVAFEAIVAPDTLGWVRQILTRAMAIEVGTRHLSEETRIWFRFSESERAAKRDGLSVPQLGVTGLRKWLFEAFLKQGSAQRWHSQANVDGFMRTFRTAIAATPAILLLKTTGNTQSDWVRTGRAYTRIGLTAASLGLWLQPCSQVLQEYSEMTGIQEEFNSRLRVTSPERVQMVVRVGRAKESYFPFRRELHSLFDAGKSS